MSERDDLIALVLLAFGGFVIWEAWRMPRFEQLAVNPYTVPGLVPGLLGAAIVLFALVMLTRTLGRRRIEALAEESDRAEPAGEAPEGDPEADDAPAELDVVGAEVAERGDAPARGHGAESLRRLLITLGLTLGYALLLIGWLPFWLATFVFVFGFIVLFDWRKAAARRRIVRLVVAAGVQALLVAGAVTLVFERLFLVRLP